MPDGHNYVDLSDHACPKLLNSHMHAAAYVIKMGLSGADPGIFKGWGGPAEFSSKRGGGVEPLIREQLVLQINKIFSKRGGRTHTPLDLPLPLMAIVALVLSQHPARAHRHTTSGQ